jgi:Universal stress protein family
MTAPIVAGVDGSQPGERALVCAADEAALHGAAARASLLVLGCRHAEENRFARLGPVSSRLLHSSPCPVAIVGRPVALAAARVADDLALARQS